MDLRQKAMLVRNFISCWTGKRVDKKISKEIAHQYGASENSGKYTKYLVDTEALKPIKKASSNIKTYFYKSTLPWSDNGERLLPSKVYMDFTSKMRELEADFDKAVSDFVGQYEELVQQAQGDLNGMFDIKNYPCKTEIAQKFGVKNHISPIPAAADFRVNLNADEIRAIKVDIEMRNKEALGTATKDIWKRLYEVVSSLSAKMKEEDPVFRNSLIGNITDLCRLLPKLNITDDPELADLAREVERKLCMSTPKELRESPDARQDTAKEADAILQKMEGYI